MHPCYTGSLLLRLTLQLLHDWTARVSRENLPGTQLQRQKDPPWFALPAVTLRLQSSPERLCADPQREESRPLLSPWDAHQQRAPLSKQVAGTPAGQTCLSGMNTVYPSKKALVRQQRVPSPQAHRPGEVLGTPGAAHPHELLWEAALCGGSGRTPVLREGLAKAWMGRWAGKWGRDQGREQSGPQLWELRLGTVSKTRRLHLRFGSCPSCRTARSLLLSGTPPGGRVSPWPHLNCLLCPPLALPL